MLLAWPDYQYLSPNEVEYSLSDEIFINLFSLSHVRIGVCPEDDLQTSGRIECVRRYKLLTAPDVKLNSLSFVRPLKRSKYELGL